MEQVKDLWVDKYRPNKLDDYILNSDLREYFANMIKTKSLQNFSLAGCAGMGKTTLAKVLANEFNADVLFIKCATDGTLDILRTKITEFCNAMSIEGKIKIVILDELDSASATGQNNFMLGLRTVIEAAQDDTRFICTCNYAGKLIPAILSRCPLIPLKFDKHDLLKHVKKILDAESISYDRNSLKAFIDEAFHYYPDCRRIINYLQFCCNSGTLVVKLNQIENDDRMELLEALVTSIKTSKSILDVRSFYIKHKEEISDYVTFASEFYNHVIDNSIVVDSDGILKMTDLLYQLNQVVDKESMFFGMVVAVKKYLN